MGMRGFSRFTVLAVCAAVGIVFATGTITPAKQHTVIIKAQPAGPIPPRPAPTVGTVTLADECASGYTGEFDDWAYICNRESYHAWFKFDLSAIPDGAAIQAASFTALMVTSSPPAERTLWYEPTDSWTAGTCPGTNNPAELVGKLVDPNSDPAWQTFDLDLTGHNWSNDLTDNYVTLMLTGPENMDDLCGEVALGASGDGPSLAITYDAVPTMGSWGMIALSLVLLGSAVFAMKRRRILG